MGLHTRYLGHVRVVPALNADEIEFLRRFNETRHCGDDDAPLRTVQHPAENEPVGDVEAYNRPAPGMPGLWCPWTCCATGCCLHWDGVEKPYAPAEWLTYLIDTFLRPGAALSGDPQARRLGLSFDHVLNGMLVGERRETAELFALEVRDNTVTRRVLVPGAEGTDEWGYRSADWERESRQERIAARRRRFEAAIAEDLRRAG
jgi:hypothetical protein